MWTFLSYSSCSGVKATGFLSSWCEVSLVFKSQMTWELIFPVQVPQAGLPGVRSVLLLLHTCDLPLLCAWPALQLWFPTVSSTLLIFQMWFSQISCGWSVLPVFRLLSKLVVTLGCPWDEVNLGSSYSAISLPSQLYF